MKQYRILKTDEKIPTWFERKFIQFFLGDITYIRFYKYLDFEMKKIYCIEIDGKTEKIHGDYIEVEGQPLQEFHWIKYAKFILNFHHKISISPSEIVFVNFNPHKNFKVLPKIDALPNKLVRFFSRNKFYIYLELYHCLDKSKYFKLTVNGKEHLFNKHHAPTDDLFGYVEYVVKFLNKNYGIKINVSDLIIDDIDVIINKRNNEFKQLQDNK